LIDGIPDSYQRVDRTFAFVDLSGFTAYVGVQGDSAALEVLQSFKATVRHVASRKGVRIAKWLGDGAMLVGTEPERIIEAVIEIEGLVNTSGSPLELRAGIARGSVLLVEGEDHIGESVNLAARLCDLAKPRQVLAPESVVPSSRTDRDSDSMRLMSFLVNCEVEPVGDLEISGLAEPIPVVRLLPEGGYDD